MGTRGALVKPKAAPTATNTYGPVGTLPPATGPLPPTFHGPTPDGYTQPGQSAPPLVTGFDTPMMQAPSQPFSPSPYTTDPGYQAALGAEQLGVSQLDSQLRSAQERAIIDFGDPALAGMAGFGLDPQAAAFARQNYLSGNAQLARLDKSKDLARQAVINKLAAHGILASGDLGYGLGEADTNYGNQAYDARRQVLDYLNGLVQQTLGSKRDLRSQVVDALQNAYSNYSQHPEVYPGYAPQQAAAAAPPGRPQGETAAARALRLRSEALNHLYGLG